MPFSYITQKLHLIFDAQDIYIYVYHYRRQGTCFLMDKYNSNGLGGFS